MRKQIKEQQDGFTIIEVVLVLAIAGLIFLVVFLALPQLQKSQRDSERRSDVGRLVAGVTSFVTNNSGDVPDTADVQTDVVDAGYVEDDFAGKYVIAAEASVPADAASAPDFGDAAAEGPNGEESIYYLDGADCDASWVNDGGGTSRTFAIAIVLESGGTYCAEG